MTNETSPAAIMLLANKALTALDDTEASNGEKIAALRTAAFAIEQAMEAQTRATLVANIMQQNRPK